MICISRISIITIGESADDNFVTDLTDVLQFKLGNGTLLLIRWKVCIDKIIIIYRFHWCYSTDNKPFIWLLFDQTQCEFWSVSNSNQQDQCFTVCGVYRAWGKTICRDQYQPFPCDSQLQAIFSCNFNNTTRASCVTITVYQSSDVYCNSWWFQWQYRYIQWSF